ncbi:tetratricopeptide repeat protein [Methyloceanibacter superfactus]|uniref:tetratricopeptide repeat protein n=1 Tax=Methyloceanibacter superfactus TaxID=1774969 RepID=UPI001FCE1F8D|nr:tetratricopeptide repeat protein [Methyloceanibacter superfactus]
MSETQKARTYYAEAAALDPDNVEGTYYHGWFQLQAGSLSDAEAAFQRIVGNAEQGNEIWRFWSRIGIGDIHQDRGDLAAALDEYRAASEMAKPMAEADPEWQRGLAIVYGAIGDILMRQGQFADALTYYRDKTEIAYRIVEADQESVLAQNDLAVAVLQLGKALELQDKREEALKAYQASVALFQRLITVDPENVHWQQSLSAPPAPSATRWRCWAGSTMRCSPTGLTSSSPNVWPRPTPTMPSSGIVFMCHARKLASCACGKAISTRR